MCVKYCCVNIQTLFALQVEQYEKLVELSQLIEDLKKSDLGELVRQNMSVTEKMQQLTKFIGANASEPIQKQTDSAVQSQPLTSPPSLLPNAVELEHDDVNTSEQDENQHSHSVSSPVQKKTSYVAWLNNN